MAVGPRTHVPLPVQRVAAERARGTPGRHDGTRALGERACCRPGQPHSQQGRVRRRLEVSLRRRLLPDLQALDDDALRIAVPDQGHRPDPEVLLDRARERRHVLQVRRRHRGHGCLSPGAAQHLVQQLVDPLREHLHLLLLEGDAGHAGAGDGLQEEGAIAGLTNGSGDEALRRVVVEDGHEPDPTTRAHRARDQRRSDTSGGKPQAAEPPTTASLVGARRVRRRRGLGANAARSAPTSLVRPTNGRVGVYVTTDTEHGETTIRWKASRWAPSASASTALMTSPCETATHTASGPCSAATRASQSRTASTARDCMARIDSPSGPGNTAALGCSWTTFHSGSRVSVFSSRPVQSPYRHSPSRSSVTISGRATFFGPATERSAVAVCWHRSRGLLTTAASGTGAIRSASARACCSPWSSSRTPGVQPARTPEVLAVVRPCRTSRTVGMRTPYAGG